MREYILNTMKKISILNIASQVGSIEQTKAGFGYSYRISKAALNMLIKTFAAECPEIKSINLRTS